MPDELTQLTLERINRLGRQMDSLVETIGSMTRMFALQFGDMRARMDRIEAGMVSLEARMVSLEGTVRGYASEQLLLANQILSVGQSASQAHRRLDEIGDQTPAA
jgi:chorismate-pyruvate lyase